MTGDCKKDHCDAHMRRPAKTSPWYVLATIHGEQTGKDIDSVLHEKNRISWNRYIVTAFKGKLPATLKEGRRIDPNELVPLSDAQRADLELKAESRNVKLPVIPFETTERSFDEKTTFCLNDLCFEHPCVLDGFLFPASLTFKGSWFHKEARLSNVTVWGVFSCQNATFCKTAHFDGAMIRAYADFEHAEFRGPVRFDHALFEDEVDFQNATFCKLASFKRTSLRDRTDFTEATFESLVPDFRHVVFPFNTFWNDVKWPHPGATDGVKQDTVDVENHYAALRYAMNRMQRFGDELEFLAYELEAKRGHVDATQNLLITLYLKISDGGRSVLWPLFNWAWMALLMFFVNGFTLAPAHTFNVFNSFGAAILRLTLGSAFVIGSPIFDYRRQELLQDALATAAGFAAGVPLHIPLWLLLLGLLHAGLSAICLFLVGLAVRNWLRMR